MLKETRRTIIFEDEWCLNPYFNGTCSKRVVTTDTTIKAGRLNPYFNGTCSKRHNKMEKTTMKRLNPYFNGTCSKRVHTNMSNKTLPHVLILILMEHAQRDCMANIFSSLSLNPYFNGTCSKSTTIGLTLGTAKS